MHAEIISIGDEITSGQLLDTNAQWLSLRLEELGIRVRYHTSVGDQLDAAADVFRAAVRRCDVVLATGGLGPTADDLTREAIAEATGRELVLDPEALEHVRGMFARRAREMPKRNRQQAMFPAGARMIRNPNGTAPGIDLEVPREGAGPCRVIALPGVPAEIKEMWHDSVADLLAGFGGGRRLVRHKRINCFGAGESHIEAMLPDLIRRGRQPRVGINASQTTIILRITAEGATEETCYAAMGPTIATIRENLGTLVFGEDDDRLQDAVVRLLRRRKKTLATVEWGTAGLVAGWLGGVAEAAGCYRGGLVVPDESALKNLLGVDEQFLAAHPPTGAELARAMAAGCRERFASDYALAVGAFPEVDAEAPEPKPFYCALATADRVNVERFPYAGHPATLTVFCAKRALNFVRLALL
ncbi:MAG TPA: CinA family nicotinamide mononucleotide deamidase-related protein [Thermoguttaceae bacterium]|nr:CinA family nicotinamide mononucleotide deamidase-related protein [Thermoguttaceae bacterium]